MYPKKLVGGFLLVLCSQLLSTAAEHRLLQKSEERSTSEALDTKGLPFLTQHGCGAAWTSWPSLQAEGAKGNTFLVFQMFAAIGNLFITFLDVIRVARFLEVGVVLDSRKFSGFRVAFDPSDIMWDVNSEPIIQRAREIEQGDVSASGMHSMVFRDGALILSEDQFSRLKSALQVDGSTLRELVSLVNAGPVHSTRNLLRVLNQKLPAWITGPVEPCAWNMLFRRSPALVERLTELSPWKSMSEESQSAHPPDSYVAWHIRTVDPGERARDYNASRHTYMITEPPRVVCSTFEEATTAFQASCSGLFPRGVDVFVSANSKDLASECITKMATDSLNAGQIDMGGDTHTEFSGDPNASMNAFLDFMTLVDATVIVRTGSSFSGMVATMRAMSCKAVLDTVLTPRGLHICVSRDISCA